MDTLSLVSKYLIGMEDILDDGDSMEARKLTVEKSKEELELFEPLDHKSVIVNEGSHRVVVFKKAPPRTYSRPFTRFSLPYDVDGQGAWDDMADSFNYITKERFDQLGFVRVYYGKYGRKMVKEVRVEIHGFTFLVDFVVTGYANEGEPSILFGTDFLVTSKSRIDFGIGEMRINLTMLEEMKKIYVMLDALIENLEEVGSSNDDLVKMGKASRNKNYKVNKLTPPPQIEIEKIPPISAIAPPSPICHPLTPKQKEKVKEVLDHKYKELEESKPILDDLENCMTYRKKLDEVLMGRARLNSDDYGDPKPYNSNLTMADNTQDKAMGEVKNVRFQIGTCGAVIDMGGDTLCIYDGVIRHTYLSKPGAKAYLDNFEQEEEEDDWLSCFEVGRDEDGNPKYRPIAPSFLNIEDDMERALSMEAYFNPFKNIIIFKKLIDFLSLLPEVVGFENDLGIFRSTHRALGRLKNDQEVRKTPKNNQTKKPTGSADMCQPTGWDAQLHGWDSDETPANQLEVCARWLKVFSPATQGSSPNLLIANFKKRNKHGAIEYRLQQVKNTNLKWRELPSAKRHAYCERLSKLQDKMKYEYLHDDGDVFVNYSWERAFSIYGNVYTEWCLEFFSTMYFDRGVDRTKLMTEKCIWFRHCGVEKVLTLPECGYLNDEEVVKCLEPIECETWTAKMLANELDEGTHSLIQTEQEATQPGQAKRQSQEPRGLDSSWEDWNASLNEIERKDVWRDSMLMRNNYILEHFAVKKNVLEHFAPILHHLADQSNFAYPAYEPPNVPPYPYPYVPYPHPYTHYPSTGSPSFGGDHYEAHGDSYHVGSIVPSFGYEIGGSSAGFREDDFDPIVHSEDCVESDDNEMRD
nr:hypothetical protein [Tanacetum cinerariifolium]